MNLADFSVSSEDLNQKLTLYYQYQKNLFPVTSIELDGEKILLTSGPHKPLTLDQFNARMQETTDYHSLYLNTQNHPKIFGYRLSGRRIIFC